MCHGGLCDPTGPTCPNYGFEKRNIRMGRPSVSFWNAGLELSDQCDKGRRPACYVLICVFAYLNWQLVRFDYISDATYPVSPRLSLATTMILGIFQMCKRVVARYNQ